MTTEYKVWVGCLACYNNGDLVGDWFDATEAPTSEQAFREAVPQHAKLEAEDPNPHEELWVFDHEGSPVEGEYSPNAAQQYAGWISELEDEQAEPFRLWLANSGEGLTEDSVERFQEDYAGRFDDLSDYVAEIYPDTELPRPGSRRSPQALRFRSSSRPSSPSSSP